MALDAAAPFAAPPFTAPTVDRLSVRLVVDSYHDIFMPKAEHPDVRIEHVARMPGRPTETFACEWGLSLHLESEMAGRRNRTSQKKLSTPHVRQKMSFGTKPASLHNMRPSAATCSVAINTIGNVRRDVTARGDVWRLNRNARDGGMAAARARQ